MNSFFCEDTKEEEQLLQKILQVKQDNLPDIIQEIITKKCLSKNISKNEPENVKLEIGEKNDSVLKNHKCNTKEVVQRDEEVNLDGANCTNDVDGKDDAWRVNEELLKTELNTNIFTFHVKKNGIINADTFFLPYKSEDDKDIITMYTYNYNYYDVYTENIEATNKLFHANKRRLHNETPDNEVIHKKIKIKQEKGEEQSDSEPAHEWMDKFKESEIIEPSLQKHEKTTRQNVCTNIKQGLILTNSGHAKEKTNFQKFLSHFRGRLFIGCNVIYSFFKSKTYLATIQNSEIQEGDDGQNCHDDPNFVNKKIQTYNLIKNAIYWKQDEYPDVSDSNIQKFMFLLLIPALCNNKEEHEITTDVIF
ncbi:ribonuclease H2 subunit C [Plasmodium gonderi]|uniref:Ribonuclease H2 subunit C n=1 Tax=Plasmodium gonderi TaxID=77519 RepID=A0A1Y1JCJ2_PLAGO|nr:ribonuclease H2 subunit C [Plasmodium gonderi]GAW80216.1 ribonuclease H2 subunit C [Plasmodium gonderi]